MNVEEGSRRMRRAGKWIVIIPLILAALFCLLGIFAHALNRNPGIIGLALPLIPIVFFGAVLWLAGWIVEGFAKNTD